MWSQHRELASNPAGDPVAEWGMLLPDILSSNKPLTKEMFWAAISSVSEATQRGNISEEEAGVLLRHITNAWLERQLNAVIMKMAPRRSYLGHRASLISTRDRTVGYV